MIPSTAELDAGRKAYQRIKSFGRYKTTTSTWVAIILIVGAVDYTGIRDGHPIAGVFWTLYLAAAGFQHWRQKIRCAKDYKFLEQLKLKYGSEIYSEIQTEPSSFYYRFFQKLYWPDSRRRNTSVALP